MHTMEKLQEDEAELKAEYLDQDLFSDLHHCSLKLDYIDEEVINTMKSSLHLNCSICDLPIVIKSQKLQAKPNIDKYFGMGSEPTEYVFAKPKAKSKAIEKFIDGYGMLDCGHIAHIQCLHRRHCFFKYNCPSCKKDLPEPAYAHAREGNVDWYEVYTDSSSGSELDLEQEYATPSIFTARHTNKDKSQCLPEYDSDKDRDELDSDSDEYGDEDLGEDDDVVNVDEVNSEPLGVTKWYCVNCTMGNFGDVIYCHVCGEHKKSGILKCGFFASAKLADASEDEMQIQMIKNFKAPSFTQNDSDLPTVLGYTDSKMHREVIMKSQPHEEMPDRLLVIAATLKASGIYPEKCTPVKIIRIRKRKVRVVHSKYNTEGVNATSSFLASYIGPDTYANQHTARCAREAAGLCFDLATLIYLGHAKNGFALVRPPGHHAGRYSIMGGCFHNNAAIAAIAAKEAGAKKVLIVDWDIHHGNGTQEIFARDKSVLYISLHRYDSGTFYPGTGPASDVGEDCARGYTVNIPWHSNEIGDSEYKLAFEHIVIPIASQFDPDFTIISAGFDAPHHCDVTPAGYAHMTAMLKTFCSGKMLVILEGGSNLRSLSSSAIAVFKILLGESPGRMYNAVPSRLAMLDILKVFQWQDEFWSLNLEQYHRTVEAKLSMANNKRRRVAKKLRIAVPVWWKWGKKRLFYKILSKGRIC